MFLQCWHFLSRNIEIWHFLSRNVKIRHFCRKILITRYEPKEMANLRCELTSHFMLLWAQRTQGIESITWVNLSTRIVWNWFQWNFLNWLQIWPPDGANCISCKFTHQMAPLALVPYLTTRWHHLHWLQTWPPDVTTCIGSKFDH